jgi:hypothetical protein
MGRKPKLYIPLTVTFFDDDRIIDAGDGPSLLYLAMCLKAKAQGSDGRLMESQIGRLNRPRWRAELAKLAALRLVVKDEVTEEWCIAAWFGHNDSLAEVDARRAADRARKSADSRRNPAGNAAESALKGREGKGREGKEGNPAGSLHAFEHDGEGNCATCRLPHNHRLHLRLVEDAS